MSFGEEKTRIELMNIPDMENPASRGNLKGLAHFAMETRQVKDSEGFTHSEDKVLASVRVYREGRHGSQRWAHLAAFSEATDLFRFCLLYTSRCVSETGDRVSAGGGL